MLAALTHRYGPPEVIEVRNVAEPSLGPLDVCVAIEASAITAGDRRLRSADFPSFTALVGRLMFGVFRPRHPIQGTVFAGRVVAIGARVTRFAVGDRVFGNVDHGAFAERIVLPENAPFAQAPANLSAAEAAALPYGGATALRFLRDVGRVKPGHRVLLVGASGGVGLLAVQLAAHLGAEVTGVCSPRHFEQVRALGAQAVIDRNHLDWATLEGRFDLIVDIAGVTHFGACKRALSPRGRYLTLLVSMGVLLHMLAGFFTRRPRAGSAVVMTTIADLESLRALAESGALRPVVGPRFALADIVAAHTAAERADFAGLPMVELAAG